MGYDKVLREGFEKLINCSLEDKWWAVARMNSKCGGVGLKSGIHTAGAQHLTSLVNSSDDILNFIPSWSLTEVANEATGDWLSQQLGREVDTILLMNPLHEGQAFGKDSHLSLAQWFEEVEVDRVRCKMNNNEKLHIE